MKSFKGITQGIQGDVALTRVDELPGDAKKADIVNGGYVVAHSETGHNHVVDDDCAVLYETEDPLVAYLAVGDTADLEHIRSYDTHETVQFDKGIYRINRQREHTPQGLRRVAD